MTNRVHDVIYGNADGNDEHGAHGHEQRSRQRNSDQQRNIEHYILLLLGVGKCLREMPPQSLAHSIKSSPVSMKSFPVLVVLILSIMSFSHTIVHSLIC